jgi:hypothetical protein
MELLAWIVAAVGGVLLLAAGMAAWWHHRTRLNDLQRRMAWTEQSRFALERHAQEVDLRLVAMAKALESLQAQREPAVVPAPASHGPAAMPPVLPPDDASERRRFMMEALERADASAAAKLSVQASPWRDTEPLQLPDTCYAPTMPLELNDEPRVFPSRKTSVRQ